MNFHKKFIYILLWVSALVISTPMIAKAETWQYLGIYKITHYCSCSKCCGKWGHITYSGTTPTRYRTVSVDPDHIPLGSRVYIDTYGYRIAEDTGSGVQDKHIDVYTTSHQHALDLGVQYQKVWLISE